MAVITLWHNPRCSKSRAALALIDASEHEPNVRLYLTKPPSPREIRAVLAKLRKPASAIVRRSEPAFADLGLAEADDEALIAAMADHPILIERPIAISGRRARVGRPPERVEDLF